MQIRICLYFFAVIAKKYRYMSITIFHVSIQIKPICIYLSKMQYICMSAFLPLLQSIYNILPDSCCYCCCCCLQNKDRYCPVLGRAYCLSSSEPREGRRRNIESANVSRNPRHSKLLHATRVPLPTSLRNNFSSNFCNFLPRNFPNPMH